MQTGYSNWPTRYTKRSMSTRLARTAGPWKTICDGDGDTPPILKKLKTTLLRVQAGTDKYPPKSQMCGAVNYFQNEWDGIEAIATGGDYSWDNNLIERINRYVSLSRKNSLFFGSHAGAERGAIFYSLACSCRLHRINFFEYLSDVLNRVAEMQNGAPPEAFRNLLHDKWTKKEQGD